MRNLITYEELSLLARPCSTDRELAEAFIAEAQREDIRRRIGDKLYLQLIEEFPNGRFDILLNGGTSGDSYITGLKTALAYYALARIIRDGNIKATSYAAVIKDDQHSTDPDTAERQRQYRELFGQADGIMSEVLTYLADNAKTFPEYQSCKTDTTSNRMKIRVIKKI